MCDIFRKISIKMVGILKKNIWERLEGKHQLSEDSSWYRTFHCLPVQDQRMQAEG